MIKNTLFGKGITFALIALLIGITFSTNINADISRVFTNEETEYWALIFAVGVYKNNPHQNRPSMLISADNLYEVLINSPQWQADHIHKVTASEATGRRLIQELTWLIQNEDSDDMSLIYLTTHGSPLKGPIGFPIDLPPRDEDDRADEILIM
ncbi:MAG: caspase family protein, partial [Thermoplasmatales archaeon]|nr:caspase family protein [Thermoplasmatales archaeon]